MLIRKKLLLITYFNQRESSGTTVEILVMRMEEQPQVNNCINNLIQII